MDQTGCVQTLEDSSKLAIRSHRRAHWFWCDNDLIDHHAKVIGAIGVALYVALARYAHHTTGQCWPSLVRLSQELDLTHLTVRKYLAKLVKHGLIRVQARPGHTALITLLDMAEASGQEPAGSLPGNEVTPQGSHDVTRGSHDVTTPSLAGNHEPDSSNQKKRTSTPPDDCCAIAKKKDTPRPVHDARDDDLALLQQLPSPAHDQLAETARQSLLAEGVAPWFLIRPVLEARMLALWSAQSPEEWTRAAENITTAA